MATEKETFTYAEVQLMLKEAGQFAYEQGKNEAYVNVADFISSMMMHPTTFRWSIVLDKIRSGKVA